MELPGVGAKRVASFQNELGITNVGKLLRLLPKAYAQPGEVCEIAKLSQLEGERVRVQGKVEKSWVRGFGRRAVVCVRLISGDANCTIPWFNQPYLRNAFPADRELWVEGLVSLKQGVQLHSPKLLDENDFHNEEPVPQYQKVEALSGNFIRRTILHALDLVADVSDPIPENLRALVSVPELREAFRLVHKPSKLSEVHTGRRRLAWGEVLAREDRRLRNVGGASQSRANAELEETVWERILARFPFQLTEDQVKTLQLLRGDLESGNPMRRLLHGEVGSGKTAVAFAISLAVAAKGKGVALLAPTEILARQHLDTFRVWLKGAELPVVGFLGDDDAKTRMAARELIFDKGSQPSIAIGTHALLSESVQFSNLGLVIFDEQHRFGVRQKSKLVSKGDNPHVLTMTATPIPRTLAWSHYGALEPCELRSRPGTSGEISTKVLNLNKWECWAEEHLPKLEKGESTFVVAPHIEGPDGLLALKDQLQTQIWPGIQMAVIHGRLPGAEIQSRVADFRAGQAQVLLGTSVVEVGLDIPAIPWMAVLQAQRFGLASLHQLRGRLARGPQADKGTCILFGEEKSLPRLQKLETCADGFAVSELDLAQRGPGAFSGTRQHGRSDFQIFSPELDADLVEALRHPEVRIWLQNKN
jgi:ATP-dependent DNA helicase RecG